MTPADHKVFQDHLNERQADYQTLMLVARHGTLRAQGELGRTALHYAASYDDLPAIERLCEQGANVNAPADGGAPPLFDALTQEALAVLVARGAKVNAQDAQGYTMLHHKACEGDATALQWLIDLGARTDVTENEGNTPLHTAAWLGDTETVDVLIRAGAPLRQLNHQGQTALDIAVQSGCQDVVVRLEKALAFDLNVASTMPAWLDSVVRAAQGLPPSADL